MNTKIVGIFVCTLVIAIAVPAFGAVTTQKTIDNNSCFDVYNQHAEYGLLEGKPVKLFQNNGATPIGDPAFTGPNDQIHPAIVRTESGILGAGYFDKNVENYTWVYSTDDGATWTNIFTDTICYDYLEFKSWAADRIFATAVPNPEPSLGYGGVVLLADIPDMHDPSTIFSYAWTWNVTIPGYNYGFHNMTDCDIACDDSQNYDEYGIITCVMSKTNDVENRSNIPFMQWADPDNFPMCWGAWHTGYENCAHTDVTIDPIKTTNFRYIYAVYDWYDTVESKWKLVIARMDFENLYSPSWFTNEGGGNLQYPAISAYDNHLLIVAETDENSNKDIVCYYSDQGAYNLQVSFVTMDVEDECYPDIRHVQDETFICTFVKGSTLYKTITEDGGENWSAPEAIDDNVIAEYKTSDLSEYAMKTLYEVDTGDDIDIYYSEVCEGPQYPLLNISSITGGIGVTAMVKNNGESEATDVNTTITITGGLLKKINVTKHDIATLLTIEDEQTVKTGMFFGFGNITITVTAECAEEQSCEQIKKGFQLLIFTFVKT